MSVSPGYRIPLLEYNALPGEVLKRPNSKEAQEAMRYQLLPDQ
jgi:hypothetical protein